MNRTPLMAISEACDASRIALGAAWTFLCAVSAALSRWLLVIAAVAAACIASLVALVQVTKAERRKIAAAWNVSARDSGDGGW